MDNHIFVVIRSIHILAAASWIGEVVVINVILLPVAASLKDDARHDYMRRIFPRVFTLASWLSATAVITGLAMALWATEGDLMQLFETRWGTSIAIGGIIGTVLTLFHFFMERRLAPIFGDCGEAEALEVVHTRLQVLPRVGLVVLVTAAVFMMIAVRGY